MPLCPSLNPFKVSSFSCLNELWEGPTGQQTESIQTTPRPRCLVTWGLLLLQPGMWKELGWRDTPPLPQPSFPLCVPTWLSCLSLPLPHLPPPSTALQVKECKFPLSLSH